MRYGVRIRGRLWRHRGTGLYYMLLDRRPRHEGYMQRVRYFGLGLYEEIGTPVQMSLVHLEPVFPL